VVAGGKDGSVWLWDPAAAPDTAPVELGYHDVSSYQRWVTVAALGDGRVVSFCGGQVLLWDLTAPGAPPVELADQASSVLAVSGDRRVIGTDRQGLVIWDPADAPGTVPLQRGEDRGVVNAAAVLRDGRLVGGGSDGRLRVWDPATPGAAPVELGFNPGVIVQIAALSDGRVVTGEFEGAVRLWDPATPGAAPLELGRHDGFVTALAVLSDGRVISGGNDERVRFWDPAAPGAVSTEIVCSVQALSAHPMLNSPTVQLVIADAYAGLSVWTVGARA
jgi:WD40 repeat protein